MSVCLPVRSRRVHVETRVAAPVAFVLCVVRVIDADRIETLTSCDVPGSLADVRPIAMRAFLAASAQFGAGIEVQVLADSAPVLAIASTTGGAA